MPAFNLSPVAARILGCLLEKERTTPENYPLSLNSLLAACNQTTNRDPVTAYDEADLQHGIEALRQARLLNVVFGSGSRVQKYRHTLPDHCNLDRRDFAILTLLLLRGPQTPGELRSRSERLHHFESLEELDSCLAALAVGPSPLIRALPQHPGQKETRYVHLLSPEPEGGWQLSASPASSPHPTAPELLPAAAAARIGSLEADLAALRSELDALKAAFAAFRKQFE